MTPLVAAALAAVQEHAPAAAEDASSGPFTINPGLIIWTLVVFGLLMFILAKTAWPAILKQVEEREQRIQAQLDAAAKTNAEAQRLLADYQAQVANARSEAQEIVASGRQAGEKLREEIVAKGRAEQEELLARARREIEIEKDRALAELRHEAVELSIAAAGKVIGKNLDTESDRRLVQDYLNAMHDSRS
ncbi:MAG: F0F1 ATP synthase subunit B [Gemmatimonadales bacterium]|nr:F0F1 ATP synthase subunit B [Gemmatimonadales bacterium]